MGSGSSSGGLSFASREYADQRSSCKIRLDHPSARTWWIFVSNTKSPRPRTNRTARKSGPVVKSSGLNDFLIDFLKGGAQCFVPLNHGLKAFFEGRNIKRAGNPDDRRHMKRGITTFDLREQPKALLNRACGHGINLRFAGGDGACGCL